MLLKDKLAMETFNAAIWVHQSAKIMILQKQENVSVLVF